MAVLSIFSITTVAGVLLYSGLAKSRDPGGFASSLSGFHIPPALRAPLARAVVAVELTLAVLIVVPTTRTWGFALATVLFSLFTVVVLRVVLNDETVSCRCFGADSGALRMPHVARNLILAAAAAVGTLVASSEPTSVETATGLGVGLLAVLWCASLDSWLDFLAPRPTPEVN